MFDQSVFSPWTFSIFFSTMVLYLVTISEVEGNQCLYEIGRDANGTIHAGQVTCEHGCCGTMQKRTCCPDKGDKHDGSDLWWRIGWGIVIATLVIVIVIVIIYCCIKKINKNKMKIASGRRGEAARHDPVMGMGPSVAYMIPMSSQMPSQFHDIPDKKPIEYDTPLYDTPFTPENRQSPE